MGCVAAMTLKVRQITEEAAGILSLALVDPDGGDLPEWAPGSHVDLVLPSGSIRQYSLCSDPNDRRQHRIAVRLDSFGRGGSSEVHQLRPGQFVQVAAIRNTFPLEEAGSYLFIAAGIGITPILPMVANVRSRKIPSNLLYVGRDRGSLSFHEELLVHAPDMTLILTAQDGRPSWRDVLLSHRGAGLIYCCGPNSLIAEVEKGAAALGLGDALRVERFASQPAAEQAPLGGGRINCARSRISIPVSPGRSYLETLRDAGIDIESSCEMGICGTCQIRVLSGEPDHRDMLLTEREKDDGAFLPCVSRSRSQELTVDL